MKSTQPEAARSAGEILRTAGRLYRSSLLECLPWSLVLALVSALTWHMVEIGTQPLLRAVENRTQALLTSEDPSELLNYLMQAQEQSQSLLGSADILKAQAQTEAFFSATSFWVPCALYFLVSIGCWSALLLRTSAAANMVKPRFAGIVSDALRRIPKAIVLLLLIALVSSMDFLPAFANGSLFLLWLIVQVVLASYLAGILLLAWVPIVTEPASVWASIRNCRKLIKGHWWQTVTILSVVLLVPDLLALIAAVFGGAMLGVAGVDEHAIGTGELLTGLAALVMFRPLIPAVFVAMYQELRQINARSDKVS